MEAPQRSSRPTIGLLTDFGLRDHYVGTIKAVIAGIAPDALTIDISHEVPAQSILAGQFLLRSTVPYFPAGSVFLAVVDPGVGTSRRPMALRSGSLIFVGPDNGLFTPWLDGSQAVELTAPEFRLSVVSSTFHGRDIFAPAAAHLALGLDLDRLGPSMADPVRLVAPKPARQADGTIEGEIVYIDHFGNLITNVSAPATGTALFRDAAVDGRQTYGEAAPGELMAVMGSDGCIELAIRDGSAAAALAAQPGERVAWRPR